MLDIVAVEGANLFTNVTAASLGVPQGEGAWTSS
jgi:hypothetical protein